MAAIDLASATWLEIGIGAAASGDHARAVSALTAISDEDWESIRARVGDNLFAVFTAPLSAAAEANDFDRYTDQALALLAPPQQAQPRPGSRDPQ
ncbi:hypothetical protein KGQ20_39285 [Catenulispora sp. NF23]|uniref:hypothetical protein n=1 Tax=Catenulispora pinistramenti TaxID=2705254 RepID=UPI001BA5F30A|nr:hypothetical protein [Catenulispora pinistramenti]MBS2538808.1 hypothetical protein [Catenulispora pinistramenti]